MSSANQPNRKTGGAGRRLTPVGKSSQEPLTGACYHCDGKGTLFCELWNVWTCVTCLTTHHRDHHKTCNSAVPRDRIKEVAVKKVFLVWLTTYQGNRFSLTCRLGERIEMEDHWVGTYIFVRGGMALVRESREEINQQILIGLRKIS